MPDEFRKVQPGQQLSIPAQQFNSFVDTARIVRNQQKNQGREPLRAIDQPGIVLVKNSAGEDLDRFHVLGLKQTLITPADNEQEFQNRVAFDGEKPDLAEHYGRFVVLAEPLKDGKIGRAWGSPRIVSELALLGHTVDEDTVRKYMARHPKPPSQNWRTFITNHDIAACDFFVVPTATFRLLFVMVILSHDRRRIEHFNVTKHPTAEWAAQQIVNAFPDDEAPKYLLRDNDGIYGQAFRERIESLGIEEVTTSYRSPWQNPYCERVIGSIRRDCLDQVIVLNERHLLRILSKYKEYYLTARCHLSLDRNSPIPRDVEPPEMGPVRSIPMVGGLHHRTRDARRSVVSKPVVAIGTMKVRADVDNRR